LPEGGRREQGTGKREKESRADEKPFRIIAEKRQVERIKQRESGGGREGVDQKGSNNDVVYPMWNHRR